jgi:hypothetical protein
MGNKEDVYKKCTLEITPCVWIRFRGDPTDRHFPQVPEDGGLAHEFMKWCFEEEIYPVSGTPGTSGPGIHSHAYFAKDIEKITKWFEQKGVKITEIIKNED